MEMTIINYIIRTLIAIFGGDGLAKRLFSDLERELYNFNLSFMDLERRLSELQGKYDSLVKNCKNTYYLWVKHSGDKDRKILIIKCMLNYIPGLGLVEAKRLADEFMNNGNHVCIWKADVESHEAMENLKKELMEFEGLTAEISNEEVSPWFFDRAPKEDCLYYVVITEDFGDKKFEVEDYLVDKLGYGQIDASAVIRDCLTGIEYYGESVLYSTPNEDEANNLEDFLVPGGIDCRIDYGMTTDSTLVQKEEPKETLYQVIVNDNLVPQRERIHNYMVKEMDFSVEEVNRFLDNCISYLEHSCDYALFYTPNVKEAESFEKFLDNIKINCYIKD